MNLMTSISGRSFHACGPVDLRKRMIICDVAFCSWSECYCRKTNSKINRL